MNWLIDMRRAAYLLSVPPDKTTLRNSTRAAQPWSQGSDPSGRPHGPLPDGSWPIDDLDDLTTQSIQDYDRESLDRREPDYESYWAEERHRERVEVEQDFERDFELYYEYGFADFNYGP